MEQNYGGRFGSLHKVFDEQDKKNGIAPDKTFQELVTEKRDKILNNLRNKLAGYQTTAQQKAVERTLASLKDQVSKGEITGNELTEAERMINDPTLIKVSPLDEDYGDNLSLVKHLLSLIANPDRATAEADKADFLAAMKGYGERNARK